MVRTLQDVIMELQRFWAEQGCVIWQPYYTQVGAGTYNPATSLRVLGPEPWRVAYVEPSIRPDDGRFGENPNRMQQHYQFQVILKPDPGNPQEVYLESLLRLGIDPEEHDIRFVEDNWESPALGAWGLGWEVWLDGQEITQFTYFQQAGGMTLDPVSVEITYGLERILIALNGLDHFRDIAWSEDRTYGDLNLQGEQEHSRYYFEAADVENVWILFEHSEREAKVALKHGLVLPAHDYVLKCSHLFNVLDTRGAVGVTERADLFNRMRRLSQQVSEAYVAQRQALGFPWGQARTEEPPPPALAAASRLTAPADFLLEIGTEELPAADLDQALAQLAGLASSMLDSSRLAHEGLSVLGTPRRLVLHVHNLAPQQEEQVVTAKGPPADRAYDDSGKPTPAAEGFARSRGVLVDALTVKELDGGRYVVAETRQPGRSSLEVLGEQLPQLLNSFRFERSMRWNHTGVSFSRPIRWLLALHGGEVVPLAFAGLTAGRRTRPLRFASPDWVEIADPLEYFRWSVEAGLVLDPADRQARIAADLQAIGSSEGMTLPADPELLKEVANLVEAPTVFRGRFDAAYLDLPSEVLTAVMKKHQRYFPLEKDGRLAPHFGGVRNGAAAGLSTVVAGNEHVLAARFADAAYFVRRDMQQSLEAYVPHLASLTFQAQLGSMLDKTRRVQALVHALAGEWKLPVETRQAAERAAALCKADLVTEMVVEMTSLQGVMGSRYALHDGEPPAVAQAIREHYLPRHAGDSVPESVPGLILGLADRLDTLAGLFAVGMQPTGTRDPFALRRTAIGLIQMLIARGQRFDLRHGLDLAAGELPVKLSAEARQALLDFLSQREEAMFAEEHRRDAVQAVLREQSHDPASAAVAIDRLEAWMARADWAPRLQAFARCVRIVRSEKGLYSVDPQKLQEGAEVALHQALVSARESQRQSGSVDDFMQAFDPLIEPITQFFLEVMVMVDEAEVRRNRLGLLQQITGLAAGVADLSQLEGF